jgi:hypothetical protein
MDPTDEPLAPQFLADVQAEFTDFWAGLPAELEARGVPRALLDGLPREVAQGIFFTAFLAGHNRARKSG